MIRNETGFCFSLQMSHTSEIKNCSQAVTGVSLGGESPSGRRKLVLFTQMFIFFWQFFANMLTYPFVLVSNLMAVNNCGWVNRRSVVLIAHTCWDHRETRLHLLPQACWRSAPLRFSISNLGGLLEASKQRSKPYLSIFSDKIYIYKRFWC